MYNYNNFPEILAPVGNTDMLYAAVRSGADAVYLGAEDFNARRNAQNFSLEDLKEAVRYCHVNGVKVYLTLNILISDNEFGSAVALCYKAYNIGIDAIIIADTGLSLYISKALPELPLHASTQMTVYTPDGLIPLKEMGFKRAVVARELSKKAIEEITEKAKELNMEIEVFIHGALCMCVSGQCLMSAFLGGRSGNRGLCAGPCRLPFSAENGKAERFDLSLKDLSLLEHLRELKEIGVASFKIEGRMKRPEYVAAAVTAARYARENGEIPNDVNTLLRGVFSRSGFTDGYYQNKTGANMFGTRSKDDVLSSPAVLPKIHELYRKEFSRVPVSATLNLSVDSACTLSVCDGVNTVTVQGERAQAALNKALDKESAFNMISKLGNTPYYLKDFSFKPLSGITLTASVVNGMRRDAVNLLDELRAVLPPQKTAEVISKPKGIKKQLKGFILRLNSLSLLPEDLSGVSALVIPAENLTDKIPSINLPIIAELARMTDSEETLIKLLEKIKENGIEYVSIGNIGQISLVEKVGLKSIFGFGMNVFSSYGCQFAEHFGASGVLLSPEMTLSQIKDISTTLDTAVIAYGKLPLMIFKNCPVSNVKSCAECNQNSYLTDRKNTRFKIQCRFGYSELFNSVPIWLGDCTEDINSDYAVLYFTDEPKEKINEVLYAFKNKKAIKEGFTRGLYFKGVL